MQHLDFSVRGPSRVVGRPSLQYTLATRFSRLGATPQYPPTFHQLLRLRFHSLPRRAWKQIGGLMCSNNIMISLRKFGAGDGIRNHDPNLGNVPRHFTPRHLSLAGNPLTCYCVGVFLAGRHPKPILPRAVILAPMLPPCFPDLRLQIRGSRFPNRRRSQEQERIVTKITKRIGRHAAAR